MANKPEGLKVPDGMRWDHCSGKLKKIDRHKVIIVDTGWPDTHVSAYKG